MTALDHLRRLWRHAVWADLELLRALERAPEPDEALLREYAHVVAAEAVWLARLEGRGDPVPIWPTLSLREAAALGREVAAGYERHLDRLTEERLGATVRYVNSAGRTFDSEIGDILLHVALHGQYHRGKLNLLLRQGGAEPAPTDYISFVRGTPAATSASHVRDTRGA
jgi:uncharacterized damage-inducible protein DinB